MSSVIWALDISTNRNDVRCYCHDTVDLMYTTTSLFQIKTFYIEHFFIELYIEHLYRAFYIEQKIIVLYRNNINSMKQLRYHF